MYATATATQSPSSGLDIAAYAVHRPYTQGELPPAWLIGHRPIVSAPTGGHRYSAVVPYVGPGSGMRADPLALWCGPSPVTRLDSTSAGVLLRTAIESLAVRAFPQTGPPREDPYSTPACGVTSDALPPRTSRRHDVSAGHATSSGGSREPVDGYIPNERRVTSNGDDRVITTRVSGREYAGVSEGGCGGGMEKATTATRSIYTTHTRQTPNPDPRRRQRNGMQRDCRKRPRLPSLPPSLLAIERLENCAARGPGSGYERLGDGESRRWRTRGSARARACFSAPVNRGTHGATDSDSPFGGLTV
ncbi:hypothetical protein GLOTRDRAFT_133952 [Gloeophyllum trabeum ATCC 11539]|uniref:Uncharacterized protein n=1 Tax=Gloeophyllum trabeum (strain ATCC 11539 / FP-39264 / Madison 617) TaxID=670483 RepID=S7RD99_GLOTA|nr:uncharacterized protein GLOTRDRAFT_133952 [Gloeophyllum trabeum ATCC 11539]EPQ50399.1 hypothetical protein GLOTRDRAFT_133952 [Gloeophyllum trabeum ATCC 11539]